MRQRHLWALVPAALMFFNIGVQLLISLYDTFGGSPYGTSYEVRWLVDLGIYLAYLAGLALVESGRHRRLHVFVVATAAFGFVSAGGLSGDSIGGGLPLLIGYFMNAGLGLVLVTLVVKQHRLSFSSPHDGHTGDVL